MTAASDLRRTDWRFLLPPSPGGVFRHVVLLGGSPTLSDLVLQLGVARRVSREIPPKDSADALVILEDAGVDLATASGCLSPGGAVYWEVQRRWTSFVSTTPAAIRRKLLEMGLTPLELHWARPNFRRPAMYVPVGPRGVFSWYVETLLDPGTLPRTVARLLLRRLVRRGGVWSYRLLPRFAVTAVSGSAPNRAFVGGPGAFEAAPEVSSATLVLLRGTDSYRRVIVFPFLGNARCPAAVVKFWRLPDRNAEAEGEQAVLGQLHARVHAPIGRTLPKPLGTIRSGEAIAGIESYAPGPPLSHLIGQWGRPLPRKLEDIGLVFDWICKFHRQAQLSRDPWNSSLMQQWVEEPCSRYRSAFGQHPGEERLFEAVQKRGRALFGVPLPIVWAHRDLTGANIHVDDRRITVIDWSGAGPRLPFYDLLYFVMLVTSRLRGLPGLSGRLRCFRDLFVEPARGERVIQFVRQSIHQYMTHLEIDSRFFPLLLVLAWVVRSLECSDRAECVARGVPGANPHPDESYVEYVRTLGEGVDRLFLARGTEVPPSQLLTRAIL